MYHELRSINTFSKEARFWISLFNVDLSKCLEWQSAKCGYGYGRFFHDKTSIKAHREMWRRAVGEIPEGLHVLHKCDNRKCVNPLHLFIGTHQDNVRDMVEKKRNKWTVRKGEAHHNAIINDEIVREIRRRLLDGEKVSNIANRFHIREHIVYHIKSGDQWSHVK